jgi:hypothetical protein
LQSPFASVTGITRFIQHHSSSRMRRIRTNENIRQLDIPMQDPQRRHMNQSIHDLTKQSPSFILRNTFINPLHTRKRIKKCNKTNT